VHERSNRLWWSSLASFTTWEFHHRCDCRAIFLTSILNTGRNVLGGLSPVEWESSAPVKEYEHWKGDDFLRSVFFQLSNPHGVPEWPFLLRTRTKQCTIYCSSACCAHFGDTDISNKFNSNRDSHIRIGTHYCTSTEVNNITFEDFFLNAAHFRVKKIKVFEITDSSALLQMAINARMSVYSMKWQGVNVRDQPEGSRRHKRAKSHRGR
jgi:hypothetical protein